VKNLGMQGLVARALQGRVGGGMGALSGCASAGCICGEQLHVCWLDSAWLLNWGTHAAAAGQL
jgi:hypothetical protein